MPNDPQHNCKTYSIPFETILKFSSLSRDKNPIHIDLDYSRSSRYGGPVVPGALIILTLFEILNIKPQCFHASFYEVILADENFIVSLSCNTVTVRNTGGQILAKIHLSVDISERPLSCVPSVNLPSEFRITPILDPNLSRNHTQSYLSTLDDTSIDQLFPTLKSSWPLAILSQILFSSYVVGMEAPGLDSLFLSLTLKFLDIDLALMASSGPYHHVYRVSSYSKKTSLVTLDMPSTYSQFVAKSCSLPRRISNNQDTFSKSLLHPYDFPNSVNALVIGGSSGLGAAASVSLSSIGINTTFTYRHGDSHSRDLCDFCTLNNLRGHCTTLAYDVLNPSHVFEHEYDLLLYFASPRIKKTYARNGFSMAEYMRYHDYYATGLLNILSRLRVSPKIVYYPSTQFINTEPSGYLEYIKSKIVGELLLMQLSQTLNFVPLIERLPQVLTRQNISVISQPNLDSPSSIMNREILKLASLYIALDQR